MGLGKGAFSPLLSKVSYVETLFYTKKEHTDGGILFWILLFVYIFGFLSNGDTSCRKSRVYLPVDFASAFTMKAGGQVFVPIRGWIIKRVTPCLVNIATGYTQSF